MSKNESVGAASMHPIVPRPLADEVAEKAKRVFQFMVSQDGNKAFGSVLGTKILSGRHHSVKRKQCEQLPKASHARRRTLPTKSCDSNAKARLTCQSRYAMRQRCWSESSDASTT